MKNKWIGMMVIFFTLPAYAGSEGNGGDLCEMRIKDVRGDIAQWIQTSGPSELTFPNGINLKSYKAGMTNALSDVQDRNQTISCVDSPLAVEVSGVQKVCKNFSDEAGNKKIICYRHGFMEDTTDSDQYVLIHHELAGIAGLETNRGTDSDYAISSQLSGFLETIVIKRLSIHKIAANDRVGERQSFIEREKELHREEMNYLAPDPADQVTYRAYMGKAGRGISRIMQGDQTATLLNTVRGGGAFFSFMTASNEYDSPDIGYDRGAFQLGFAGIYYGFMAELGDVDLESLSVKTLGVKFAADYMAPGNDTLCEGPTGSMRAEQNRVMTGMYPRPFETHDGFSYFGEDIPAHVGSVYVVRNVHVDDGRGDALAAFKIVRQDPADGSLIFIWRVLKTYAPTSCKSNYDY